MNANGLPETLVEAIRHFADEGNCHDVLVSMRWPSGKVTCPHCESDKIGKLVVSKRTTEDRTLKSGKFVKGKVLTRRVWNCKGCGKQFSAKLGTIFEDSPLSLNVWLPALWMIVNCKNGVSSYEIHRALGITQKSAWFVGHRLRVALHEGKFIKLSGIVEADETWIGGVARNMHKHKKEEKLRGNFNKAQTPVQGLLERDVRKQHSRVRLRAIKTTGSHIMQRTVRDCVEPGSFLVTDGHAAYRKLSSEYEHRVIDHAIAYAKGHVHINGLENFWSLLKRTVRGTYVCPREFHLFRYLDEQAFRFNERKGNDGDRFELALSSVGGKRLTWGCLTGAETPAS